MKNNKWLPTIKNAMTQLDTICGYCIGCDDCPLYTDNNTCIVAQIEKIYNRLLKEN